MTFAQPSRPRQAVVLAGGRGTRLGEIGRRMPKAMVPFGGMPFLTYLLQSLREQGFERVLLLLGYKAEQIVDYCGDGARFGLAIDYSITPVEDDTGQRIKRAEALLDPVFLLLYSDNIWPLAFEPMWRSFLDSGAMAQVTVYRNREGYTRDNLRVDPGNRVELYDRTRTAPGLAGVDIGFLIARREVVALLPDDDNVSFEAHVYPRLVAERQLAAYATDHRYYSVGTPERLPETERFLARRPFVILDRDGVLNVRQPKASWVTSPDKWQWLPGALDGLARLARAGAGIAIVTNQAGVAHGALTEAGLAAIHQRMLDDARAHGTEICAIYHCPHGWESPCECRKPKPGMLFQAQRDHALDLSITPFVGDDERDGIAADAAGCPFIRVDPERGLAQAIDPLLAMIASRSANVAGVREPCPIAS